MHAYIHTYMHTYIHTHTLNIYTCKYDALSVHSAVY